MNFTVGGEAFELTAEQVIRAMKRASSEPVQRHVVDIDGHLFPPKQVFATVTGRPRQSFTTMEAQRVLTRLGFVSRTVDRLKDGDDTERAVEDGASSVSFDTERLSALEAAVGTLQVAIAGLHSRVTSLEVAR